MRIQDLPVARRHKQVLKSRTARQLKKLLVLLVLLGTLLPAGRVGTTSAHPTVVAARDSHFTLVLLSLKWPATTFFAVLLRCPRRPCNRDDKRAKAAHPTFRRGFAGFDSGEKALYERPSLDAIT
jgi:hypothetical protein